MNIEEARTLESEGKFELALIAYRLIDLAQLTISDKTYVKRSIAACLFYQAKYSEAELSFRELLDNNQIDNNEKEEINDCLNICYLYGTKPDEAYRYFYNKLNKSTLEENEKMWCNWYIGQYFLNKNDFSNCLNAYEKSSKLAHQLNVDNKAFFFAHYLVSCIYNNEIKKANMEILQYELNQRNEKSYGLLKIVKGIIYKILRNEEWQKIYNEGIFEADKSRYQENIDLGVKLEKEFG